MSLKSKNKEARPYKSRSLQFAKDMIFGKQKFDFKQVQDEQIYKIYLAIDY